MIPSIIILPGYEYLGELLLKKTNCRNITITIRAFPDKETYVRIHSSVKGQAVFIMGSLDRPNSKILPLIFLAAKAKEMGARSVILVSPYLPYMRQDQEFNPGECVTARHFAKVISSFFDHLITVDPHLHRIQTLGDLYKIPNQCLQSAPLLADWIKLYVENPVILGPDSESKQWVQEVAALANLPFAVFSKKRIGDDQVVLELPEISEFKDFTPVLVDDIISTAGTMIKAVELLKELVSRSPVCLGIHPIFTANSYQLLSAAGAARVVSTNTVPHMSNKIDISDIIKLAIQKYLSDFSE